MSKASEWAAAQPTLGDRLSPIARVNEYGNLEVTRTRALGAADAIRLAHWIIATFADEPPR